MYSKLIEHSIYKGKELITLETQSPMFVDADCEKHCGIGKNSSSNRAIPYTTMLEQETYLPQDIRINEKGMQGFEQVSKQTLASYHFDIKEMHKHAIDVLNKYPEIHKQHNNRYLMPFTSQKKVWTASREDFEYFFNLRDHKDADPNMQELAKLMKVAVNKATNPRILEIGDWHAPYITKEEYDSFIQKYINLYEILKMSSARCARTSYLTHDKKPSTLWKDVKLFDDTLVGGDILHASALDHQGMAIDAPNIAVIDKRDSWPKGVTHLTRDWQWGSGKMKGFVCFRHWYLQGLDK
jgi:hypothetical protein